MADMYKNASGDIMAPARRVTTITPGSTDLTNVAKSLIVLVGGNATIIPVDNADAATISFTSLTAGQVIPIQTRRVTTATATLAALEG